MLLTWALTLFFLVWAGFEVSPVLILSRGHHPTGLSLGRALSSKSKGSGPGLGFRVEAQRLQVDKLK